MASGIEDLLEAARNNPLVRARKGELPGHKITVRFDYYNRYAACSCGWRFAPERFGAGYVQRSKIEVAASRHAKLAAAALLRVPDSAA